MVDNRPETTNVDGIAANHTEDFDYPVAEAFFVNGFIKEKDILQAYEWDSQPKNNDRSTQRIANIGTNLIVRQTEDGQPIGSEHGMIITREPDLRIPFEGILHPESVFPPSGSMEATQEMRPQETWH